MLWRTANTEIDCDVLFQYCDLREVYKPLEYLNVALQYDDIPCGEIAREPGRSPSTMSAEIPSRPRTKRGFPRRRRIRTPPQRNPRTRISTCEPVCSLARVFRSC